MGGKRKLTGDKLQAAVQSEILAGATQVEIAAKLRVSPPTVCRIVARIRTAWALDARQLELQRGQELELLRAIRSRAMAADDMRTALAATASVIKLLGLARVDTRAGAAADLAAVRESVHLDDDGNCRYAGTFCETCYTAGADCGGCGDADCAGCRAVGLAETPECIGSCDKESGCGFCWPPSSAAPAVGWWTDGLPAGVRGTPERPDMGWRAALALLERERPDEWGKPAG